MEHKEREKKRTRGRRAGSSEETFAPFPEKESVRWRVKEKGETREGKESGCV